MKNLFEQIEKEQSAINRVDESGLRNIKALAKKYKTATGYFHMDSDGVTSAIAMKKYLESFGIKTVKVNHINYGGNEFKAAKPQKGTLTWMVDFAHGKPFLDIHTDHHDSQTGVKTGETVAFTQDPANVAGISQRISPRDLFPPKDIEVISMVDSAGFKKFNVTPEQVMNAAFGYDKSIDVDRNHMMMGLVVNKLLLTYKNKKGFLEDLVMNSNASLISMYNVIKDLAKKNGYKTPAEIGGGMGDYIEQQKGKMVGDNVSPKQLKNGDSTMWGTTIVQYGGGGMFKGYDRYTPFKLHPEAEFLIIAWPMGLIQVSKNPFKSGKNPEHLGDIVLKKVLPKWKGKLSSIKVSFADIKRISEMDIKPHDWDAMGFTYEDLVELFDHKAVRGINLDAEGGYNKFIRSVSSRKWSKMTRKQKDYLEKITISLWDVITSQSGGHKDITNLSGLNFYGKGYVDELLKPLMVDIAKEMKDKKLV